MKPGRSSISAISSGVLVAAGDSVVDGEVVAAVVVVARVVLLLTGLLGASVWVGRGVSVVGCLLKVVVLTCADDVNGFSWIGCV